MYLPNILVGIRHRLGQQLWEHIDLFYMFQCYNILSFKTEKRTKYLEVGYLSYHDLDSILSIIQDNREIEKADRSYWPARFQQYTPVTKMLGQMTQELRERGYYGDYIWGDKYLDLVCSILYHYYKVLSVNQFTGSSM